MDSPQRYRTAMELPSELSLWVQAFTDLIWPRSCVLCGVVISDDQSEGFCPDCLSRLMADDFPVCPRCSSTVGPYTDVSQGCSRCRKYRFRFSSAIRLGPYDGRLREAILRMKHLHGEPLAEWLGETWARRQPDRLLASDPQAIVPIPLHWHRRWQRGYNQSAALARSIAETLGCPFQPGWLIRVRPTTSQREQTAGQRWDNVRDAFRVPGIPQVRGAKILLIDDVMTTGATADAAAAALRQAGAAQVALAVLAHR